MHYVYLNVCYNIGGKDSPREAFPFTHAWLLFAVAVLLLLWTLIFGDKLIIEIVENGPKYEPQVY